MDSVEDTDKKTIQNRLETIGVEAIARDDTGDPEAPIFFILNDPDMQRVDFVELILTLGDTPESDTDGTQKIPFAVLEIKALEQLRRDWLADGTLYDLQFVIGLTNHAKPSPLDHRDYSKFPKTVSDLEDQKVQFFNVSELAGILERQMLEIDEPSRLFPDQNIPLLSTEELAKYVDDTSTSIADLIYSEPFARIGVSNDA